MTDSESNWLIEHRRTTRDEAKRMLLLVAVLLPLFVASPWFFVRRPDGYSEFRSFYYCWYGILTLVTLAQLLIAWVNWKADGVFVCRLSAAWLECQCPAKSCGESFRIAISEIDELEEDRSDTSRWYVRDRAGRRYWLTSNYRNPDFEIVQKIRELRPELCD